MNYYMCIQHGTCALLPSAVVCAVCAGLGNYLVAYLCLAELLHAHIGAELVSIAKAAVAMSGAAWLCVGLQAFWLHASGLVKENCGLGLFIHALLLTM